MIIGQESSTSINLVKVAKLKAWLHECGFPQASLFMFRENDRNAVFLRIRVADAVADLEMAWLVALNGERGAIQQARERIQARLSATKEPAVA